jgi:uncharacterized protein involved in exopolysaccharide biosynthesis
MPADARRTDDAREALFDVAALRSWAGFMRRSLRRHWLVGSLVALAVLIATGALVLSTQKKWVVTSTVLAQSSATLQSSSTLFVPSGSSTPKTDPSAVVLAYDNLAKIDRQLNLGANLSDNRPTLSRWLSGGSSAPLSEKRVVDRLRADLAVTNQADSVSISLTWVDPKKAVEIVKALDANFIADRKTAEISPRVAAVGIIQGYKDKADEEVGRLTAAAKGDSGSAAGSNSTAVKDALANQQNLSQTLGEAKIDLDAARAAFRLGYQVSTPPQVPDSPASGRRSIIVLAGLIGALAAAFAVCVAIDLLSATVVEPAQLSRRTGIPLLAELP